MKTPVSNVTVVAVCPGDGPALDAAMGRVRDALSNGEGAWRFVFVDDGTDDGTFARLLDAARGESRIGVMRQDRRRGFGAALRIGLARCASPIVCGVEVDEGFSPDRLADLVRRVEAGADVATGRAPGWACAFRAERIDLKRGRRLPGSARLAVEQIADRARRAGLALHGDEGFEAAGTGRGTGIGGQLRKFGIAIMSRGARSGGAPQRAA